jgi:hypothetical protein
MEVVGITPAPANDPSGVRVRVKVSNAGKRPLYYIAYGREGIVVNTETWTGKFWASDIILQSGLGFEQYELAPGESVTRSLNPMAEGPPDWHPKSASDRYPIRFPMRFRCTCVTPTKTSGNVTCYSRVCAPEEFIRK